MATYTAKQAAKKVREDLGALAEGKTLHFSNGTEIRGFPPGLRFEVRATPKGKVNVTIGEAYSDRYLDRVTGGNRHAISDREHLQPIVDLVLGYEKTVWRQQLGKVEWGSILISVSAGKADTISIGDDAA
jgi:hypothetical protein